MAIDNKYGRLDIPGIPENEPVFVLRAQDSFALPTIIYYKMLVSGLGRLEDKMVSGLSRTIYGFSKWAERKLPD
jgi:hypothetical protein